MTLVNVRRYRDLVVTLLGLAAIVAIPFGYYQWKLTNEALREAIYSVRNVSNEAELASRDLKEASKQIKFASFELRPQLTALVQDLNSAEQQRARLATMRSGESVARAAEEAALVLQDFRADVLPQYAAIPGFLLRKTDKALEGVPALILEGQAVLAETRQTVESANAFLTSPEIAALLPQVRQVLTNANATTAEISQLAAELAHAAGRSDAIAAQVEGVLLDARKTLNAGERTLNEGSKTLGTLRKTTWISALASLGGLLR